MKMSYNAKRICTPCYVSLPLLKDPLPFAITSEVAPNQVAKKSKKQSSKRKKSGVGPQFQADLTKLAVPSQAPPIGTLIWDPTALSTSEVETFLNELRVPNDREEDKAIKIYEEPKSFSSKDRVVTLEAVLMLLRECGYNLEVAIERAHRDGIRWHPYMRNIRLWSKQDGAVFKRAIILAEKHFNIVHQIMPSKTTQQLVEFYFYWKIYSRSQEKNLPSRNQTSRLRYIDNHTRNLRDRPRVIYRETNKKRKKTNSPLPLPLFFDVGVYVEIDWERLSQIKKQKTCSVDAMEVQDRIAAVQRVANEIESGVNKDENVSIDGRKGE